ncbi:MAG: methionyl-tRNA formyltransferase [Polyangiaceae bacterium]
MRTLFFGTPAFAAPSLDALAETTEVVGVVCQPDRPVGRGLVTGKPPVKQRAEELGLLVVQPTKLRTGEFAAWVKGKEADLALVVAYGRILPADVLAATRLGFVNVHASLLPKYRGAAPITWAVVHGEAETGVTLMLLDEGMDTGDMLDVTRIPIGPDETAGELSERLSRLGAEMVRSRLGAFARGDLPRVPQDHTRATVAPLLEKRDGLIDWSQPAHRIHDRVRGMNPWPGAMTYLHGKTVKVHATRCTGLSRPRGAAPGAVLVADKSRVLVACGGADDAPAETIELVRVQLEGKKAVTAVEWVSGRGVREGDVLGRS